MKEETGEQPAALVLTTDLPYFPGKMGVDFFNLRHLSKAYRVGVVGPLYDSFPAEGVANLEAFLDGAYFWPRQARYANLMLEGVPAPMLNVWIARLPARMRSWGLKRLLGIAGAPADALGKLAILSNCAPQLWKALTDRSWSCVILIQTNLEPWFQYLPPMGGKLVYFHDVRADYMGRKLAAGESDRATRLQARAIHAQEQAVALRAEVAGFVSKLDEQRAHRLFEMRAVTGVAPISVDTSYYTPAPHDWEAGAENVVLFTGHLAHPPNVDAVIFFLKEIWPLVLAEVPDATFHVVGMVPAEEVISAVQRATNAELHANVTDIRPYFWNAVAYVVPMRYGGGVRQKILEAWSMRVPVVCTTMAAEGTGGLHDTHCFLEDEPATFAKRVVQSLSATSDVDRLLDEAKDYVESNNSTEAAAPNFAQLVDKAVEIKGSRPYKVLFDLRWMELGHAGGIEQATYELVTSIGELDRRNGFRIMAPRSACGEWSLPDSFDMKFNYTDGVEREREVRRSLLANGLAESLGQVPILNTEMRNLAYLHNLDFDIVHSVAGYTHPDLITFPNVLTINDLQHLHHPEFFSPGEFEERERLYRASADQASHIICISEFTRQDVHRQYGIPLEKMSTVWIVPSRNVWHAIRLDTQARILAFMGLDQSPFLFFPAHCWPHKNHARLVDAFAEVASRLPPGLKLVMTGREFPEDHPAAVAIRRHRLGHRIVHLGYRSPLEIRALFQGCLAVAFPSLFEGYGMPVAEAVIAGKPVICSNATSLPEIAGDAAVLFDPMDVEAIGEALVSVANDATLRERLSAAAVHRRHMFAARRIAVKTLSIYQRVYDELYGNRQ